MMTRLKIDAALASTVILQYTKGLLVDGTAESNVNKFDMFVISTKDIIPIMIEYNNHFII